MDNRRVNLNILFAVLLLAVVIGGLTLVNYRFAAQNPGGNDFLSRWVGTRLYLTRAISPYSQEATGAIHQMAYGRAAKADEDQMLFVYPLYSILVVGPFALIGDYAVARAAWMTFLEIILILLTLMGLSLTRWSPPRLMLVGLLVFAVLWYHGLRPVINGNPSVVVALLVWLAFMAIRARQDALAGFLLALSTIKPQMVILFILFTLVWAISHRRSVLVWSFVGSLGLLVAGASLLIPDWIVQNLVQVFAYPGYTLAGSPGAILASWLPGVGNQLGWLFTILCTANLLWEWRLAWRQEFTSYLWTAGLTLALTNLIGIRTATENYVILFPVFVLVLATWDERWGRLGRGLALASLLVMFFGLWALFLRSLDQGAQPMQDPVMFFPLPLFLWVGLYWVRWWALNPPRLYLDELRRSKVRGMV